jgi:signal transduction histidine kinase
VIGEGVAAADAVRLHEVLGNMIDNAVRFADRRVVVTVHSDGRRTQAAVEDDGPGVPPEERASVFDRFSRGRNPKGPGSGLGLAVARELARVDGAELTVGTSELGGARFEADYPARADRSEEVKV